MQWSKNDHSCLYKLLNSNLVISFQFRVGHRKFNSLPPSYKHRFVKLKIILKVAIHCLKVLTQSAWFYVMKRMNENHDRTTKKGCNRTLIRYIGKSFKILLIILFYCRKRPYVPFKAEPSLLEKPCEDRIPFADPAPFQVSRVCTGCMCVCMLIG